MPYPRSCRPGFCCRWTRILAVVRCRTGKGRPPFPSPAIRCPLPLYRLAGSLVGGLLLGGGLLFLLAGATASPARAQGAAETQPSTAPASNRGEAEARRLFVRGMTRAYVGDTEGAIDLYRRALEKAPNEAAILSALAEAHATTSDLSSALFYAQKARDRAPANPHYHAALARLQRENGQIEAALSTYRRMADRFPEDRRAQHRLAATLADADRHREALEVYRSLAKTATDGEIEIRRSMLALYREVEDPGGIARTLRTLIDLEPGVTTHRTDLARLYRQEGRIEKAIGVYEPLLQDTPSRASFVSDLASLYRQAGRPAAADSLLRRYTDRERATPDRLVARAWAMYQATYQDAAAAPAADSTRTATLTRLLEAALQDAPSHPQALDLLGQVRYEAGQYAEAGSLLTRALDADPRSPERWTLAASAYLRADRLRNAAETAEEGLLLFPGQAALARISGRAHLQTGDPETARDRLREALSLTEDGADTAPGQRADLYEALGTAHRRLGDFVEARQAWNAALNLAPDRDALRQQRNALPD